MNKTYEGIATDDRTRRKLEAGRGEQHQQGWVLHVAQQTPVQGVRARGEAMLYVSLIIFGLCLVAVAGIIDKWEAPFGAKLVTEEELEAVMQPLAEEMYAQGVEYGLQLREENNEASTYRKI